MGFHRAGRLRTIALAGAIVISLASGAVAQRYYGFRNEVAEEHNVRYDGRFTFMRLKYHVAPGGFYYRGTPAWAHGFANTESGVSAEHQLMKIMDAISAVHPHLDESNVFAIDDPDVGYFPVAYMTEAGYWELSDAEAAAFRAYLEKGGFVIFDDFRPPPRGGGGWETFADNMRRILPWAEIVDLQPTNPIFHVFYDINSLTIIPQDYDFNRPIIRGIFQDNDRSGRLLAVINYNTDVANFWEFSGTGRMMVSDSNEAFKLGVNYLIYGLTH
ncbi:MAG TPA: DUF4159 domain-containing protein [Vicinamibacterales bacterium]|nr:DUF4159 domain-containing protein [Vicinamibacterales bacterium]